MIHDNGQRLTGFHRAEALCQARAVALVIEIEMRLRIQDGGKPDRNHAVSAVDNCDGDTVAQTGDLFGEIDWTANGASGQEVSITIDRIVD